MTKERRNEIVRELSSWINRNSLENLSNTPDFILAEYLMQCLESFSKATLLREDWYGREKSQELMMED